VLARGSDGTCPYRGASQTSACSTRCENLRPDIAGVYGTTVILPSASGCIARAVEGARVLAGMPEKSFKRFRQNRKGPGQATLIPGVCLNPSRNTHQVSLWCICCMPANGEHACPTYQIEPLMDRCILPAPYVCQPCEILMTPHAKPSKCQFPRARPATY
jgi:hypothetical protein